MMYSNILWEMLMNALKTLVYELFLQNFYGKIIKQLIFPIVFYIFRESDVKNFSNIVY